jgi:hypothetical protein
MAINTSKRLRGNVLGKLIKIISIILIMLVISTVLICITEYFYLESYEINLDDVIKQN